MNEDANSFERIFQKGDAKTHVSQILARSINKKVQMTGLKSDIS